MNDLDTDSVQSAIAELKAKGYGVRRTPGPCQREASYAFVLSRPMMATALFGPARSSVFAAWASAQEHAEQGETAASKQRLAPFYAAELPSSAFDASAIAQRFGVDVESAERQVQQLRCQSIFLSETYQVNVQLLRHPFGPNLGDVAWLSIKRRDREVVRDWRELQAIKNAIVGPGHEGFELYPAESRLVDTANQFHLFVFMDRRVRMPVGSSSGSWLAPRKQARSVRRSESCPRARKAVRSAEALAWAKGRGEASFERRSFASSS